MSEYQTTIQDPTAIVRGSGMIEFDTVKANPTWPVKAGAVASITLDEEPEEGKEENDNAESSHFFVKRPWKLAFNKHEALEKAFLELSRNGLDTFTQTAGTLVSGAEQTLSNGEWAVNKFYKLIFKNSDGSCPTINSVIGATDGSLVVNDDFDIIQDGDGNWGIVMQDTGSATKLTTEAQNLVIDMDYTPAAKFKMQGGKNTEIPRLMCRITVKNDGKLFTWIGYYGRITKGLSFPFAKDDDADRRVKTPVEMMFEPLPEGKGDPSNQDQVYELEYEGGMG